MFLLNLWASTIGCRLDGGAVNKYDIQEARELLDELLSSAYEVELDDDYDGAQYSYYLHMDVSRHSRVLGRMLDTLEVIVGALDEVPLKPTDQEIVEPLYDEMPFAYGRCPYCGNGVTDSQDYCDACGQPLDWSDE